MEKYLEGEDPSEDEIWKVLRKATLSGKFFPVSGGDSRKGNVVPKILDLVVRLLPSPDDIDHIEAMDVNDPEKKITVKCEPDCISIFIISYGANHIYEPWVCFIFFGTD